MGKISEIPEKKIALVTGATRGIGAAIACELGKKGMTVIGTATTAEGADKISHYLREHHISGQGMLLNVCDEANVMAMFEEIQKKYGAITALVNNAGITRDNLLLRMKQEQWDEVIETNLTSVYRLTKLAIKSMLKNRYGRVINITSVVGVLGNPGQANYVAAKAGLIGFTKAMALELAGYGITINAVAPGFISTDMTHRLNEKQQEAILAAIPMKRMGKPEDIAYAVGYFVDDRADYITGQTLHVNGGMCMV
ncbi:MAG: 3-oxoacyl-[acyl-carrier-protein] reductase [Coxiella sp. RIFCSPHIGHO2_12_FULL_42_15]|nr:MAG: 3-oxoacyl-[acyl-carrier-protein] reductase [Coxiella sp. RIFCSPHIGHO2_12_FULL_42_15]